MGVGILLYTLILCSGAFEYRTGDTFSLFPHQVAVQNCSWPVVIMNPAFLPCTNGFLLNSSAARPYSEKELYAGGLYAQYGGEDYGLQLSWNSFGADFYCEQTFSAKAGFRIFSFFNAGVSENIYLIDISMNELSRKRKAADTDGALLLTPCSWIGISYIQSGIVSLITGENEDILYPERSAGIIIKPAKGFSLAWDITETAGGWVNSFSAVITPAPFFTINGGYCRENSSLVAAFGILTGNISFSYSLRYHPYLGYTHSAGITFAPDAVTESLDYGRPFFSSPVKKINIKTATIEDIRTIDGISGRSASRVILYRDKIGPVTEKALTQIGMSGEEIKIFESVVYGLHRTPREEKNSVHDKKRYIKRLPRNERIKNKFREMIASGIPSTRAISYSELSESGDPGLYLETLHNDKTLTDEQKRVIEKTCSKYR